MKDILMLFYLDYVNKYLTVDYMADSYGLSYDDTIMLIEMGKKYHKDQVNKWKRKVSKDVQKACDTVILQELEREVSI